MTSQQIGRTVDSLIVSFDSSEKDLSGLVVIRHTVDGDYKMLKGVVGEQADILYRLLTEQMITAEIKAESEDKE